jgi:hypothetical protein
VSNDIWWREKDRPEVRAKLRFVDTWLLSYNCFAWNLDDPLFRDAACGVHSPSASIGRPSSARYCMVKRGQSPDRSRRSSGRTTRLYHRSRSIYGKRRRSSPRQAGDDTDGDGTLDQHGQPFVFTMLIPVGTIARDQTQVFQAALRQLGVRMEITTMDGAAFFDRVLHRNFQSAFFSWFNEPDPDPYSLFHSSQLAPDGLNVGGYKNAHADRLLDAARVELDRSRRARMYHDLHVILARDQPYLWTVQVATKWAVNRRIETVRSSKGLGLFLWYPGPYAWEIASPPKAAQK